MYLESRKKVIFNKVKKMEVVTYRNYNAKVVVDANPEEIIESAFKGFDKVLECIDEIDSKIREDYIQALRKNLLEEIEDYNFNSNVFDLESIIKNLEQFKAYSDIQDLIIQLVCKHMKLPEKYNPEQVKFEILEIDQSRAFMLWRFYRVKAFIDVLGREKGIDFWKKIVIKFVDYSLNNSDERKPINEIAEGWMKFGRENIDKNQMDFTVVVFDDNRVLLKFDWCGIHESLKYLDDPELSYLAYCYMGDIADKRTTKIRRRRRSQTLHLGEFCDEFFWDNNVLPDAKQPPVEFMRKLGKENPNEIIEEYQGKV